MDWDKLRIFHAVAEAGSFTHAGEKLNLSQSAVSRQISSLEASLDTPLFHRHARGLILTEQGETLHRTVHDVYHMLAMAESQLTERQERPSGPLKITTTVAFGSTWLTPHMKEFIELFPEIDVSLALSDEELDLAMREADVALRMAPPRQPDLIQRPLLEVRTHIYASKSYIDENGAPETPEDLDRHRLIIYGHDAPPPVTSVNWLLDAGGKSERRRRPAFTVNNLYGMYRAVRSGLGLASLPDYMVPPNVDLVRVLPEISGPQIQCYFVYPEELRHSKRIEVFRDFLLEKAPDHVI
ncbi:MAG: LysR family transcriptional regulator [Alphaproteobacteria bacterium]|jgi:DNA-binding transcriptional LysR family regulator|nr:LysR family transcriptional regulator [Alphaproteobacteria bacterium]